MLKLSICGQRAFGLLHLSACRDNHRVQLLKAPSKVLLALFLGLGLCGWGCPGWAETLSTANAAKRAPLLLVNAIYPPFVNAPNHPSGEGMDIEIAREALRRHGYEVKVELYPWRRALLMLERGEADFTTTISRTGGRDAYLSWSQPYRNGANYLFFSLKNSGVVLTDLTQLKGKRLGVIAGFNYPKNIVEQEGLVVEKGGDISFLAKMLQAGRTDLFVVTAIAGSWEIADRGLGDVLQKQAFEYRTDSPNYMAFSNRRANDAALEAMRSGLSSMEKDGSLARIERKYRSPVRSDAKQLQP